MKSDDGTTAGQANKLAKQYAAALHEQMRSTEDVRAAGVVLSEAKRKLAKADKDVKRLAPLYARVTDEIGD